MCGVLGTEGLMHAGKASTTEPSAVCFEIRSHKVAQTGLKFTILLPQPLELWIYVYISQPKLL